MTRTSLSRVLGWLFGIGSRSQCEIYAAALGPAFIIMDDNVCPHTAVNVYLANNGIVLMEGLVYLPDINPLRIFELTSAALQEEWLLSSHVVLCFVSCINICYFPATFRVNQSSMSIFCILSLHG